MNEQEVKAAAERMTRHRGLCGRTIDSFSPYFHPQRHNNFDSRLYYADRNLLADWALSRIAKDELREKVRSGIKLFPDGHDFNPPGGGDGY